MTTPVVVFKVYVPTPATVTMPSASHASGDDPGVIKHVMLAFKPPVAVAKPFAPVMVANVTVPPAMTAFASGVATGTAGFDTVGVTVAPAN